jgi:hypothetical protein
MDNSQNDDFHAGDAKYDDPGKTGGSSVDL